MVIGSYLPSDCAKTLADKVGGQPHSAMRTLNLKRLPQVCSLTSMDLGYETAVTPSSFLVILPFEDAVRFTAAEA